MSKIEEALEKARLKESEVRLGRTVSVETGRQLRAIHGQEDSDYERQLASSRQISQMQEPWQHSRKELAESRIIFPGMEDNRAANSFRELRTKILQATRGKNCALLVTSASSAAGCSFVARNLAVAFSFDESKTALLMDCNLQNPSHNELVPPEITLGLTDYLKTDELSVEQIIHPVGIQRLRLIPAGSNHDNTTEYFTSIKMKRLFRDIKDRYIDRYIIIDAPPIISSADTRILADVCDYAVLVVPYGKTTESQVVKAARAIDADKLIGVVLNNEPQPPALSWLKKMSGSLDQLISRKNRAA